ncbi:MAG: ABC transporter permease [Selenomonadaceae bacterium]|nr:ABC transporter permease [Selenomonadaceae bacterium]
MRKGNRFAPLAGAVVSLLFLWHLAAVIMARPIVPSPGEVLPVLAAIFADKLVIHLGYSLWRIVGGVLLAVVIGYPLGIYLGYSPRVARLLSPVIYLTYPTPKIALLPIVMLLFGLGEMSKLLLIFLIVVYQVVIAIRDAAGDIPAEYYYPLTTLGADFTDIFRHVLAPATLPAFFTALRVAMATAVSVLFFTETFGTEYGLGYFIMDAWLRISYREMYAGIIVLAVLGIALFMLLDWLDSRFNRWQK